MLFLIVALLNIYNHVLWRDEFHSWLIVSDAQNFHEVIANRLNEGHPLGWYLIIYFLQIFTKSIVIGKLFVVIISTISVYLILKYSPFTFLQKLLLCFNYYTFFEYTIFLRPYGVIFLITISILSLYHNFNKNIIWIAILLLLVINMQAHGTILAGGFYLYAIHDKKLYSDLTFNNLLFIMIPILGAMFFLSDIYLLQDLTWVNNSDIPQVKEHKGLTWLLQNIGRVQEGLLPFPNFSDHYFWNTSWLEFFESDRNSLRFGVLSASLTLIFIGLIILLFKYSKKEMFFLLLSFVLLTIFIAFFFQGQQRHFGFYFISFLMFLWLVFSKSKGKKNQNLFISIIFGIVTISGAISIFKSLNKPFSNSNNVAIYINQNYPTHLISGVPDYSLEAISGYLNKPYYNFQKKEQNTFVKWGDRDDFLDKQEFKEELKKYRNQDNVKSKIILISTVYYEGVLKSEIENLRFIKKFENAIVEDENYMLFEIE